MAKLSQKKFSEARRIIVFGGPKVGKTELVGRLAEKFNLVWFDLERGAKTLTKLPLEWQERIELISLPDTRIFPIAIETMLKVIGGDKKVICELHGKVACPACTKNNAETVTVELNALPLSSHIVVIDGGLQLANSAMAQVTRGQPDDYKYDWDDYRKQGTLMDKFLGQVQQAAYNVIVITHEVETEMDDGKAKLVPAMGTASFSRNSAKYFDDVVRAEVKNKKHAFGSATTFSINALTGSRTDVEIEKSAEPSLLPFFDLQLASVQQSKREEVPESEDSTTENGNVSQPSSPSISALAALRAKAAKSA